MGLKISRVGDWICDDQKNRMKEMALVGLGLTLQFSF
jgi:hypothetical protein